MRDLLLGVNNNILSKGELATLFSEVLSSAACSFGKKYTSSCFWTEHINQFTDDELNSY